MRLHFTRVVVSEVLLHWKAVFLVFRFIAKSLILSLRGPRGGDSLSSSFSRWKRQKVTLDCEAAPGGDGICITTSVAIRQKSQPEIFFIKMEFLAKGLVQTLPIGLQANANKAGMDKYGRKATND